MGRDYRGFIKDTFPPHFEQTHPGFRVESVTLLEKPTSQCELVSVVGGKTAWAKWILTTMKLSLVARDDNDESAIFSGILMYEVDYLHERERMVFRLQYKLDPVD